MAIYPDQPGAYSTLSMLNFSAACNYQLVAANLGSKIEDISFKGSVCWVVLVERGGEI